MFGWAFLQDSRCLWRISKLLSIFVLPVDSFWGSGKLVHIWQLLCAAEKWRKKVWLPPLLLMHYPACWYSMDKTCFHRIQVGNRWRPLNHWINKCFYPFSVVFPTWCSGIIATMTISDTPTLGSNFMLPLLLSPCHSQQHLCQIWVYGKNKNINKHLLTL